VFFFSFLACLSPQAFNTILNAAQTVICLVRANGFWPPCACTSGLLPTYLFRAQFCSRQQAQPDLFPRRYLDFFGFLARIFFSCTSCRVCLLDFTPPSLRDIASQVPPGKSSRKKQSRSYSLKVPALLFYTLVFFRAGSVRKSKSLFLKCFQCIFVLVALVFFSCFADFP